MTTSSDNLCRVCGKELSDKLEGRGPFCSERCRLNDLSKWFGESYRIASLTHDDGDSKGSPKVDEEID